MRRLTLLRSREADSGAPRVPSKNTTLLPLVAAAPRRCKIRNCPVAGAARLARLPGAADRIYDVYYRGLSTDASHASVTALNRYVEADEHSMIVGLRWGPEVSDVQDTLMCVCTAAIYLIRLISDSCGLDDLENRMGRCWADYKKLIEAQSRDEAGATPLESRL